MIDKKRGSKIALFGFMRRVAKRIPFLYQMAGYVRYIRYRRDLARAQMDHPEGSQLPPPALRYRVHRSFDPLGYEQVGRAVADSISIVLNESNIDLNGKSVLDLGSGPGRVAYWVKQQFPNCALHCSDIDEDAISWAGQQLAEVASFHLNYKDPPIDFQTGFFDFVYCVSLFTHLDREMQDEWLDELQRVVKPGGHVLATTHGRSAIGSCTNEERAKIERAGFHYRVDRRGALKLDGLPDFYQTTFHSKKYVETHWTHFFEIIAYIEGGISDHQDVVLMRRR